MADPQLSPIRDPQGSAKQVDRSNKALKTYVNWAFFIAAAVFSCFNAGFVITQTYLGTPAFMQIVYEHFTAIVALPFAGFASLGLVLLLESRSSQPLEFKIPGGFEFKGASGPIILWILCFITVTICIKFLW